MGEALPLWSVTGLNYAIGGQTVFRDASFAVHAGERLGLVGRNGSGKSTLLRLIQGQLQITGAEISVCRGLRIRSLTQDFELDGTRSIRDNAMDGCDDILAMLTEFSVLSGGPRHDELEHRLMLLDAWNLDARFEILADKLRLGHTERLCSVLSGGEKRRVGLLRALLGAPDLLLLDEPTNHLDIQTVQWIEDFLYGYRGAALFVSHDRRFIDRLATGIAELDHGKFYFYPGSYADFIAGKAEREAAEDAEDARRHKFLRSEIEWVRKSPKARLKRNSGRLKRYEEQAAVSDYERISDMDLVLPAPRRIGDKAVDLQDVSLSLGGKCLFRGLTCEFPPGVKVGLAGANGSGKTSLLRLVAGEIQPDSGRIITAPSVQFNYIDQNRLSLNQENTVRDEIAGGIDSVELGDEKISIWGYLRRFLFTDERINTQVKYLSGGEKARLLLAKQLKRGGNFLLLDEPTNDLDLSTLRILEEALMSFGGSVLLVSHDRYFLNRVCDRMLVFEGNGNMFFSAGDYDYAMEKLQNRTSAVSSARPVKTSVPVSPKREKHSKNSLTYKETMELGGIESRITAAEARAAELENIFSLPDFFAVYGNKSAELQRELATVKAEIDTLYTRWMELDARRGR